MKAILILFLIVLSTALFGQEKPKKQRIIDNIYSSPSPVIKIKPDIKTVVIPGEENLPVERIIICLDNYQKERKTAMFVGLTGVALTSASIGAIQDFQNVLLATGGIALLTSAILYIKAERWISRKNLVFTGSGLAYRF